MVTGEKTGFKMALHSDVALTVDQIQRVDIALDAGNVTETVEVQANAQVLDTGSASVGHTVTEKQVTELPLNGRNFLQLLFLGAGAVETGGEQGGMRQGVGNAISIMGARPTSNNFMIDGTANIDTSIGTPAAVLSVDAIEEFKEQTTTYSAEYGFSSNQINLVSKTGTNSFHGTGFGFFRNDGWDARNFFDDKTSEAPKLDQKQYGFVVGGPVMLPGYNGRNRTFFLVNYEGTRIDRGATNFYTVPTPQELTRALRHDDHRSADRPAVSEQHHSAVAVLAARAAGHPEQLVPGAEQHGRAGQLPGRADLPAGPGPVHDPRRSGSGQARTGVRPLYGHQLREHGGLEPDRRRRPGVRPGHAELAGLAQLADQEHARQPVPHGPRRGPGRPARDPVPPGGRRLPRRDRRVHQRAGRPARVSEHRDEHGMRARAARSTPTPRATSRCGTSATR